MLNISDGLKQALLTEGTKKVLYIDVENSDFSKVNFWYTALWTDTIEATGIKETIYKYILTLRTTGQNIESGYPYVDKAKYYFVSFDMKIKSFNDEGTGKVPASVDVFVHDSGATRKYVKSWSYSDISTGWVHYQQIVDISDLQKNSYGRYDMVMRYLFRDAQNNIIGGVSSVAEVKNVILELGTEDDYSKFPYEDATQVEFNGGNIADYLTIYDEYINFVSNTRIEKESLKLTESICSAQELKFGACEGAVFECNIMNNNNHWIGRYIRPYFYVSGFNELVYLGRFRVFKEENVQICPGLTRKRIEAYDGMLHFGSDASSWYAGYMGAKSFLLYTGKGYQLTRQMFSAFYNICQYAGIQLEFSNKEYADFFAISSGIVQKIPLNDTGTEYIGYYEVDFDWDPYKGHYFRLDLKALEDYVPTLEAYFEDPMTQQSGAKNYRDFGMMPSNGGIYVKYIPRSGATPIYYAINDGDVFYIDNLSGGEFTIMLPVNYVCKYNNQTIQETLTWPSSVANLKLEQMDFDMFNHHNNGAKLVYYNWETLELATGQNVTVRDVLRSLIELTGGFLRYGRTGDLEYITAKEAGLYPRSDLYPASNLYPQAVADAYLPMTKYLDINYENYHVADYGKIQIVAGDVKTATYTLDGDNTYIMDDNVFYSDSICIYKTDFSGSDVLPQVEDMLEYLLDSICELSYTPYDANLVGLPWIETGDRVRLKTANGWINTFVFERTLTGIQILRDNFTAEGRAENEQISEYDWR